MTEKDRKSPEEREIVDENRDGIDDNIEPPIPDVTTGSEKLADRMRENTNTDPSLSAGDVDAKWEDADSTGDEAIAGSQPTPGQSDVDEMGKGMGVQYQDNEPLKLGDKERARDKERWELDPASSEGYQNRRRELASDKPSDEKKEEQ